MKRALYKRARSITPKVTFNFVNPPIKLDIPKTESLRFIPTDYNTNGAGVRKVEKSVKAKKIILN